MIKITMQNGQVIRTDIPVTQLAKAVTNCNGRLSGLIQLDNYTIVNVEQIASIQYLPTLKDVFEDG